MLDSEPWSQLSKKPQHALCPIALLAVGATADSDIKLGDLVLDELSVVDLIVKNCSIPKEN